MTKSEELIQRIRDACDAGASRITIEPKADGEKGALKFMVFIRSDKKRGPLGHSICPNLTTAFERAISGFEQGSFDPATPLDAEAESLL